VKLTKRLFTAKLSRTIYMSIISDCVVLSSAILKHKKPPCLAVFCVYKGITKTR
jgi:hypothetical protein